MTKLEFKPSSLSHLLLLPIVLHPKSQCTFQFPPSTGRPNQTILDLFSCFLLHDMSSARFRLDGLVVLGLLCLINSFAANALFPLFVASNYVA